MPLHEDSAADLGAQNQALREALTRERRVVRELRAAFGLEAMPPAPGETPPLAPSTAKPPFQDFFDEAPIGKSITALSGLILYANRTFATMLGYTPEELCRQTHMELTHAEDIASNREAARRLLSSETARETIDKRFITKGGHIVWAHLTTQLHRDSEGQPRYFLTHIEDLTRYRRAVEQGAAAEAYHHALIENAMDGIATVTSTGHFDYVSPSVLRRLDGPAGSPISLESQTHPDDWPKLAAVLDEAIAGGLEKPVVLEYRGLGPEQCWRWFEGRFTNLFGDPTVKRLVVNFRDIHHQKSLSLALTQRVRELACHHWIGQLIEAHGYSLHTILDQLVTSLPDFWRDPSRTTAHVTLDRQRFGSPTPARTDRVARVPLFVHGKRRGALSVRRALSGQARGAPAIMDEEQLLLEAVGQRLSRVIERIEGHHALQASEERLTIAMAAAGQGFYEADVEADTLFVSAAHREALNVRETTYTAGLRRWADLIHPDDQPSAQAALGTYLASKTPHHQCEYRLKFADGTYRWVVANVQVTARGADGQPIRVIGTHTDIDERMRTRLTLQDREERLRVLLETMPTGWAEHEVVFDANDRAVDCRFLSVNRAFETFTGLKAADICNKRVTEVIPNIRRYAPHLIERLGEVVRTGQPQRFTVHFAPQGRSLEFSAFTRAQDQCVALVDDITDRVAAQKRQATLNDMLARSNAELEQFAYVASHDLQEPLRMVASFTQLLRRRYGDQLDANARTYMDYAVDGAQRMQRLITALLAFSRVGRHSRAPKPVDCAALLGIIQRDLGHRLQETGGDLRCADLPTVMGDFVELSQIFQNLITNALKFHGHEPPRVEVSAIREGNFWAISVRDNGIGIDPCFHDRIFVVFSRLHAERAYPGTGIGLATVRKLVQRHGGAIRLDSALGKGATFTVTLPAAP